MSQTAPKFIGKRIMVNRTKDSLTLTILQKVERWQEALLMAWVAAWLFCGIVFIYEMLMAAGAYKIFLLVICALWLYFMIRIGKVLLWRLGGREILTFTKGQLAIQHAFWSRGKKQVFHFHNIFKVSTIKHSATSLLAFMDNSFWIMGGDRIEFSYSGRKVVMGKQLDMRDAEALVRITEQAMKEYK
ncbi:MAG: hypothetical protein SH856_11255 [Flavobacteriales bacterium]|nr:hypothetical protein [Flavobacteriales bacterium]